MEEANNLNNVSNLLYTDKSSTKDLLELFNEYNQKRPKAISTGLKTLDSVLYGGFFTGLYILGAVTSLGKTSLALQIASNIAEKGRDVLFFSLEMSRKELLAKIISRFTYENQEKFARNTIEILNNFLSEDEEQSKGEIDNRNQAFERLKAFSDRIFISEGIGNINVFEIKKRIEEHIKITGHIPFVVIDYVQIIAPLDVRMTDKQAIDKNITELKRISRDFDCTILGISSFNRESYKEEVSMASFKESGAIEYGSDVLIGIQYKGFERKSNYFGNNIESDKDFKERRICLCKEIEENRAKGNFIPLQLKILKNRNGKISKIDIFFKPPYNYFTDDETRTKEKEIVFEVSKRGRKSKK